MKIIHSKLTLCLYLTLCSLSPAAYCLQPDTLFYTFHKGSIFKKHYSKEEKIDFPYFSISNGIGERKISFPLGTRIWKDKKDLGCVIVTYMDKRFAAFGSSGYSLIDIQNLEVFSVANDIIYEIDSHSDEFLIGIQRMPEKLDYLDREDDSKYEFTHQILFIIRFDYKNQRFQRLNLLSGYRLPDDNYAILEKDRKEIKRKFFVKDGVLFYEHRKLKKQFRLSDFEKHIHKYHYHK